MTAHEQTALDPPAEELLDTLGLREQYEQGRELLNSAAALEAESTKRLDQFADEARRGLWRNRRKLHALAQACQQAALRAKDPQRYVEAYSGQYGLPLELRPILRDAAELPNGADMLALLRFFDDARQDQGIGPAFWTLSVLREAELHLYDIFAAGLRRQLRAAWQPLLDALRAPLPISSNPLGGYTAQLLLLDMLFELGDLKAFEDTYDDLRRPCGDDVLFPWLGSMLHDDAFRAQFAPALMRLLDQIIVVKQLRHQDADQALAHLLRLRDDMRAQLEAWVAGAGPTSAVLGEEEWESGAVDKGPVATGTAITPAPAVLPTPNIVGFTLPPDLDGLKQPLKQTLAALIGDSAWDRRRGDVLAYWLAFVYRHSFDLEESRAALGDQAGTEALALLRLSLRAELAYYAGDFETAQLRHGRAIELADRLLGRFERVFGVQADATAVLAARLFLGQLYQWRGNAFVALGDYTQAQGDYTRVDEYLRDASHEARLTQAVNQGNLAFLRNNLVDHRGYVTYSIGEMVGLLDEKPASFLRRKFDRNREALGEADTHYRAAAELLPHVRSRREKRRWQAIVDANLGNVAWARARLLAEVGRLPGELDGDFKDLGGLEEQYRCAQTLYSKAYETAKSLGDAELALTATCLASAGELDMLLGDYNAAEAAAFESLNILGYNVGGDFDKLLAIDPEPRPEQSWRIYLTLARVYEARGQASQARLAYERALATVEMLREAIRSDEWQIAMLQSKLQVYECAMHFFYHTAETPAAARIFDLSELLKGRAFLDLLESTRLSLDALVPRALRAQRARLDAEYAQVTQALRLADDDAFERLTEAARQIGQKQAILQSEIAEAQRREVGEINPQPLTWNDCQGFLKQQPDTILLSFTIGDDDSYLLVGDATTLDVFELPGRAAIEAAVARLLVYASIKREASAFEYAALNRALVELLLGPAIERGQLLERITGKRIVILPDGILYYLPFELLLVHQPIDAQGQPLDFESYRKLDPNNKIAGGKALCRDLLPFYMLQAGPISYAHSASVWHKLQTAQGGQPDHTALGVYHIRYDDQLPEGPGYTHAQELNIQFGDLSQTSEIAQVLDGFGGDPAHILRLSAEPAWPTKQQSTEGNFKRCLERYRVRYVIFAGHGVYNDKYPQFSGIVFNMPRRRNKVRQDGFFGLKDIFELRMPDTELVFLAACQSGIGMLSRGEGVNALTRAFMYRGSPSMVASLWSVDVRATIKLVELFFERLRAQPGADKASLMQQAKQALCSTEQNAHPYWWAAFVLMGRR